jgi:hypothetical protein
MMRVQPRRWPAVVLLAVLVATGGAAQERPGAAPPTSAQATVTSPTSVRITWGIARGARSYGVARFRQPDVTTPERNSGALAATTWDDAGLAAGATYLYRIAAQYVDGRVGVAEVSVTMPRNLGGITRATAPRLPPAPAPTLKSASQQAETIWPELVFDLPPEATGIRVLRQQAGGPQTAVTPAAVPRSELRQVRERSVYEHGWVDKSLTVLGSYSYVVVADYSDGRTANSAPLTFAPQVSEATNARAMRANPYDVLIQFNDSPLPALKYTIKGSNLPPYGVEATQAPGEPQPPGRRVWQLWMKSLAAGTYQWTVQASFAPGVLSPGVPVTVTIP